MGWGLLNTRHISYYAVYLNSAMLVASKANKALIKMYSDALAYLYAINLI